MQAQFSNRGSHDLAIGAVRGFRWWSLGADGLLRGAMKEPWTAGENVGRCLTSREHKAGEVECVCGFYAYWAAPTVSTDAYVRGVPVAGVIEGYGRTVVGDLGFRCQRARILGLYIYKLADWLAVEAAGAALIKSRVSEAYGVPVFLAVDALVADFPPTQEYAGGQDQEARSPR